MMSANVCCWADSVAKVFLADQRKILRPLMRFARGDVRDHIILILAKIDHEPRAGAAARCSGGEV
jgi:hypothetical protein